MRNIMQDFKEKNSNGLFEWTYKALCRKKNVKPLPMIETYLQKNCLRFSIDHVNLKDWSPILNSIIQDQSLSKIWVYSRCHHKIIKKKVIAEEKLVNLRKFKFTDNIAYNKGNSQWNIKKYNNTNTCILKLQKWQMDWRSTCTFRRCAGRGQQQPILYTNFLLPYFVHSIAVCLRNSLMITNLTLDGIPLAPKYLKILGDSLMNNRNLRSLSLARCQISDAGCNILLENLQYNSSLHILNLSSCCLTNRSAAYLSLFLKKRKADLLQHVWKSTLSRENVSTTAEGGLQVLILDRNYKFGDVGLRQLMSMLKNDFWLKKLHLRYCGITQHGGEIVLEFLQTNSVLAHIDLRNNELSVDMLRTICNILKKRKSKREIIPTKKRLLSHKHVCKQDIIIKNLSFQHISKENVSSSNQTYFQSKVQHDQPMHVWKTKGKNNRKCQLHIIKNNYVKWTNADELKKCLSFMIEHNQELITVLENTTDFLTKEKNYRLNAEEAYHKIQLQLENLRNKIAMQNSIHLNMCYGNQVYINLQNVFKKLKIFMNEKNMVERSLEKEASGNRINSTLLE